MERKTVESEGFEGFSAELLEELVVITKKHKGDLKWLSAEGLQELKDVTGLQEGETLTGSIVIDTEAMLVRTELKIERPIR